MEGIIEEKMEIKRSNVLNMLKKGRSEDDILDCLNLTIDELNAIKQSLK